MFTGEDDQVEDKVGDEGDGGEGDVHVFCQSGILVVIPATFCNTSISGYVMSHQIALIGPQSSLKVVLWNSSSSFDILLPSPPEMHHLVCNEKKSQNSYNILYKQSKQARKLPA